MVAAMAAFAVEDALFKTATQTIPVALALLIFGGVGLALFATLAHLRGDGVAPRGGLTRGLAIRSAFEVTGRLFFGLSLAFGDLSTTSAILQATPLVVVLGAVVVFGETVGWRRWTAILLGLVGVLMVLQPTGATLQPTAVFALLGMLGFAGRDLATRAAPPKVTNAQLGTLGFAMLVVAGLVLQAVTGTPLAVPPAADLPLRMIAAEVTREKLTLRLHEELPYQLTVETERWEEKPDGSARIDQIIYVVRDGHKGILLGKGGETIKAVGQQARVDLAEFLGRPVHLFLQVKVRPNWLEEKERFSEMGLDWKDGN